MLIQINTDRHIEGGDDLTDQVRAAVESKLDRFSPRITRVEVHLRDENSDKKSGVGDKRCQVEARLAGLHPVSASHHAASLEQAVDGALDQLKRSLDSKLGRLDRR